MRDFLSNKAKARPPRGPEIERPELLSSVSMFSTLEAVSNVAKGPGYAAELEIPEDERVGIERTLGPDHHSVWAEPELLLTFVIAVHPLGLPHG